MPGIKTPPMTTPENTVLRQSPPARRVAESCGAKGSSVTSITDPEIDAFLAAGTRTAKLAYLGMDGRPLVTPVWFIVEDGCIIFNTFRKSAKARALARDPRVTLCTDLEEPPYAFVQVQGEAELSEDPGELLRIATMIAARYMGPDRAEEFGKRNGVPGELIVRLHPTRVLARFNVTG
jgi:PPOX class probable F420-dependent enzyme